MNRAKTILAVLIVLSLIPLFPARADLKMTILNETYHVWGNASAEDAWPMPPTSISDAYDVSLSNTYPSDPWASSVTVHDYATALGSDAGSRAGRDGNQFRVSRDTAQGIYDTGTTSANAEIQADLMFAGPDDHLSIYSSLLSSALVPGAAAFLGVSLTDLITKLSWDLSLASSTPDFVDRRLDMPFDETHVYRLAINASGFLYKAGHDGQITFENVSSVVAAPVPLPGAALLGVLGLGWAGTGLRRYRTL